MRPATRVRLTCTGELHTCLGQNNKTDLKDIVRRYPNDIEMLKHHIEAAIFKKPKAHSFSYDNDKVTGQLSRFMSHTRGLKSRTCKWFSRYIF